MLQHHPDTELLVDYAAGSLAFGPSLCVAVHLGDCPVCQSRVNDLTLLGAELVAQLEPVSVSDGLLDTILADLDGSPAPPARVQAVAGVPQPLSKLIPHGLNAMPWKRLTPTLQAVVLGVGDADNQVSLIRMNPGGTIPEHRHKGIELTVVLKGGFSDRSGSYKRGDFMALGEDDMHRPIAHQNEDCICLAAQNAPLQFTGFWSKLVNPFMAIQPQ
jgi:putative transcriptional regulator